VTQLIVTTGDNDANIMIGRVNGYTAATMLVDPRAAAAGAECELPKKPGIDCGAGVEQWPDTVRDSPDLFVTQARLCDSRL